MKINRMTVAATCVVLPLLLVAGQLMAQSGNEASLTEKDARALIDAAGSASGGNPAQGIRIFRLKASSDGESMMVKLRQIFADSAMVKVIFAFDPRSNSLVASGSEEALGLVAEIVKTLDAADGKGNRVRPAGTQPAHGQGNPQSGNLPAGRQVRNPQSALRPIRVAVFDFDVLKGVDMESAALTDQVNTMLAAMDKVTIVNRDQIKKVADEHKMALSGLVDSASAAQLGKFLSANYVIVGRASKIGQTNYLVLKIIDVGTTVQTTVSAKAAAEAGLEALLERLKGELTPRVRELQKPLAAEDDAALAKVREAAKPLAGKVILVDVTETHVNRPLADPAAQMAVANRLKAVGIEVIVPKDPVDGWKKSLLETGRYGMQKVDFLVEGEGVSAYAAEMQGMISCRARVELRLIAVPGRNVTISDKGVAARVDLVESLAAKAALEDAGVNALDAVVLQHAKAQEENK